MKYVTKNDLKEYIALFTDDDTGLIQVDGLMEYLDDVRFKQDLEVGPAQFGTITSFFAAERAIKLIELLEEIEQLWSYYFEPKEFIVNFNDSGHVRELQEVLVKELTKFYKRELAAYKNNLKIKEHTLKLSKIDGMTDFQVAADNY